MCTLLLLSIVATICGEWKLIICVACTRGAVISGETSCNVWKRGSFIVGAGAVAGGGVTVTDDGCWLRDVVVGLRKTDERQLFSIVDTEITWFVALGKLRVRVDC